MKERVQVSMMLIGTNIKVLYAWKFCRKPTVAGWRTIQHACAMHNRAELLLCILDERTELHVLLPPLYVLA
jgi:hypothetical protein